MAKTTLTVRQILDLGLWDKVCEYKGWNPWILNEGRIDESEDVTFDSEFKKEKPKDIRHDLAEFLHEKLCGWNHVDGCGWHYFTDDWTESSHKKYLEKAEKMLATELYIEDIKKIIEIAKGY